MRNRAVCGKREVLFTDQPLSKRQVRTTAEHPRQNDALALHGGKRVSGRRRPAIARNASSGLDSLTVISGSKMASDATTMVSTRKEIHKSSLNIT